MALVSTSQIEALEQRLDEAVRTGHAGDLDVIGYGEITIGVQLSTPHGDFACKRLVPFSSREAANRYGDLIASYVEQLRACGIDVVETETPILGGRKATCSTASNRCWFRERSVPIS